MIMKNFDEIQKSNIERYKYLKKYNYKLIHLENFPMNILFSYDRYILK